MHLYGNKDEAGSMPSPHASVHVNERGAVCLGGGDRGLREQGSPWADSARQPAGRCRGSPPPHRENNERRPARPALLPTRTLLQASRGLFP